MNDQQIVVIFLRPFTGSGHILRMKEIFYAVY